MSILMRRVRNLYIRILRELKSRWYSISRQRIFVFGDSHAKVFSYINDEKYLEDVYFDVLSIGGATAMGVVNPNSKTNAFKYFKRKLRLVPFDSPIILLLGEVDTGFVIWYRAQKYGYSVESQLDQALDNYIKFLELLIEKGYKNVSLISAPLPTIKDNSAEYGEIARLRKEVKTSQVERTDLTLKFNQRLAIISQKMKFKFINLDPYLLSPSGIIDSKFLNNDPLNHHCDHYNYSIPIISELKKVGVISIEES